MYTLGQAAKATGKGKTTISNAIKKGRISAKKNDIGEWSIDPAELHRIYPPVQENSSKSVPTGRGDTPIELIELRVKVEGLEQQLKREREQSEHWREQSEHWRGQAERVTHLLTHQTASPKKKTVLNRIFGINQARRGE